MTVRVAEGLVGAFLALWLASAGPASAQERVVLTEIAHPACSGAVQGFYRAGSGVMISALPASAEPPGAAEATDGWRLRAFDPVSKLAIFSNAGDGFDAGWLGGRCAAGSRLTTLDGRPVDVAAEIRQWRGSFLPFTLFSAGMVPPPAIGTPLFDGQGRVAAIVSHAEKDGRVFLIPGPTVERVVSDLVRHGALRRVSLGLVLSPRQSEPRVVRVLPGSVAAKAGVIAGDRIKLVNGRPTEDYADVVDAFFLLRPGLPVKLGVERGGQVFELRLLPEST